MKQALNEFFLVRVFIFCQIYVVIKDQYVTVLLQIVF